MKSIPKWFQNSCKSLSKYYFLFRFIEIKLFYNYCRIKKKAEANKVEIDKILVSFKITFIYVFAYFIYENGIFYLPLVEKFDQSWNVYNFSNFRFFIL